MRWVSQPSLKALWLILWRGPDSHNLTLSGIDFKSAIPKTHRPTEKLLCKIGSRSFWIGNPKYGSSFVVASVVLAGSTAVTISTAASISNSVPSSTSAEDVAGGADVASRRLFFEARATRLRSRVASSFGVTGNVFPVTCASVVVGSSIGFEK